LNIKITPGKLSGSVNIPSSKSISHRALICAALADGTSVIKNISMSDDINATIEVMTALGAEFKTEGSTVTVKGISTPSEKAVLNCCESGSTLRFIIPVAAALGVGSEFNGKGRLPKRPIDIYTRELTKYGVKFDHTPGEMPFYMNGRLTGGKFYIEGDVSSQFITGLLLALPLCSEDSEIIMTSELQSKPYVDITISCLNTFGITVTETENGYSVKGGQKYTAHDYTVEADFSQAAFFVAANTMGNYIELSNLPDIDSSSQGDKKIIEIAGRLCYNKMAGISETTYINASDIPDLVPIISVMCSLSGSETVITNAERLRIKESDRLETTAALINGIGGNVEITDDGLKIHPVSHFTGGSVSSFNDHRIAMAAAIAATASDSEVTVSGFEAINKSYPDFLKDYIKLGGIVTNGISME